jgi:MFS family permease
MTDSSTEAHRYPNPRYAWYVVVLLTLAYILSYLDRQVLSLLTELVKADLGLSDTQMGLLLGPFFALFYACMGIPLGWMADRYNRRTIIGVGVALWCAATAAAGLAKNFGQLAVTRFAVGIGEAALGPSALSLITDYFAPGKRGRAIAFYTGAVSIGSGIAYLLGGQIIQWATRQPELIWPIIGEVKPWQVVFLVVGLPGLVISALMFTVREPERTGTAVTSEMGSKRVGFVTAFRYLLRRIKSFGGIFGCMSVITVLAYTHFWLPPYFQRTWGWDVPTFALYNGIGLLIVGPISVNFGGWLSDWLRNRGKEDGPVIVLLIGMFIMVPTGIAFPLMPSAISSFAVYLFTIVGAAMATAAAPAAIVTIAPGQIRSQTIALFYLTISLIGAGLGPPAVAFFTDTIFGDEKAIRYSMSLVPVIFGTLGLVPAWFVRRAFREQVAERAAVEQAQATGAV